MENLALCATRVYNRWLKLIKLHPGYGTAQHIKKFTIHLAT